MVVMVPAAPLRDTFCALQNMCMHMHPQPVSCVSTIQPPAIARPIKYHKEVARILQQQQVPTHGEAFMSC